MSSMLTASALGNKPVSLGSKKLQLFENPAAISHRSVRNVRQQLKPRCVLAGHPCTSSNPKVAVFVEPSPFSHVSGMKIRFSNLIKELRQLGSEVTVFTPCVNPPTSYCGAKVSQHASCPRQASKQRCVQAAAC